MKAPLHLATLVAGLLGFSGAHAQTQLPTRPILPQRADGAGRGVDINKVYTYVEQMPTLPNGGGFSAIAGAVQQAAVVPASDYVEGRVFVEFVVDRTGNVRDVTILRTPSPALGKAVLAAVAKLPKLKPGMQNGEATNVQLRMPIAVSVKP
jgi:TonB family protein